MTLTYDLLMGALCLWREARGATMPVQNAIWHVLLNRANDPQKRWPSTIAEVVLQPYQFSSFNVGDPNATKFPHRKDDLDFNAFQRCLIVVTNTLGDDPTSGATNYYSPQPGVDPPKWADPAKLTLDTPQYRFYKL